MKSIVNLRSLRSGKRLLLITAFAGLTVCSLAADNDYLSPIALVPDIEGRIIYVAEQSAGNIVYFDTATKKITKTIVLKDQPNGLTLSSDGSLLYVTVNNPDGKIYILDTINARILDTINAGHTPMSPVLSLDNKTLYVCNRFNNNISVINLESKKEITRIPATREPVAQVLSADGKYLFVANHLPTGAANVDHMTSVINVIDTAENKVIKTIPLPNGAIDLRAICLSQDGKYVLVPSILARFLVPTTQIERGWMNTHALNLIDTATLSLYHTVLLDDVDLGAANPWGIICSPDGKYICVAHSATHEISLIDQTSLLEKLAKVPPLVPANTQQTDYSSLSRDPANDLSFLAGIRKRIPLHGYNPRNITISNNKIYIAEHLSDSIGIVDLDQTNINVESIPLGPAKEMDLIRQGEHFFNDASLCFQKWQSCSTCHPDARTDAVNWDLLNDGIGNPKSTKSLLNAHNTPPAMITGIRASAEIAVRTGIRYIQFAVPEEEKAIALDAYLKSLKPIPSPYLINGKLSKTAREGEGVFATAGCVTCHKGSYYTDMEKYNVGTGDGMEENRAFDTPSLIEVWRTAPYLYDGRAASIKDIFTKFNTNDEHGITSTLSEREMDSLIEFVLSL